MTTATKTTMLPGLTKVSGTKSARSNATPSTGTYRPSFSAIQHLLDPRLVRFDPNRQRALITKADEKR